MRLVLHFFLSLLDWLFSLGITVGILGILLTTVMFHYYNEGLPDYTELANYDPPTVTRLYAADGRLMAEYATEKRMFVPLSAIPKHVRDAFISAEDKNFYTHGGVDITGIMRAIRSNIINYGQNKSLVGGSTITQQVVKNFLLSSEKSLERKAKEAILALRISQVYSKDKILELYLNEIYLGIGSYGVAAAAQNYFGKGLEDLTIAEAALLASQPKAPSLYNPKKNPQKALARRNWVIARMASDGHISPEEAAIAANKPIELKDGGLTQVVEAGFFSEEVRRTLSDMYGSDILYKGGLVVKTTLNPAYQKMADNALQQTLIDYDRRHGYRGALGRIVALDQIKKELPDFSKKYKDAILPYQALAVVKEISKSGKSHAKLILQDGSEKKLDYKGIQWTGKKQLSDLMDTGDVILIDMQDKTVTLAQIPEVNGALIVLDPHTGRILAMSGGYQYGNSEFNRATQAKRQPGSAFKPFVYMAALESGMTPATIIMDEPIEISQGAGKPVWRPQNYGGKFLGETTLRVGLEKSRNTMTVRLAQLIGLDKCMEIGTRMGIYQNPPANYSIVLGSEETTLLNITNAYAMIVNGGKRIHPSFIERIDDRHGRTIFRRDTRNCKECQVNLNEAMVSLAHPPDLPDDREQLIDPRIAYQVTSLLEGAVQRGTGARAKAIGKVVGGKTGTTNDSRDAWFVGFSPDLVAGVYIGFDQPKTLGSHETGASAALPAFISFMKEALADKPNLPFRVPRGIQFVRTDLKTGWPADSMIGWNEPSAIINEAFIIGAPIFIPGQVSPKVLDAMDKLDTEFEPAAPPPLPWEQKTNNTEIQPPVPSPVYQPTPYPPAARKQFPTIQPAQPSAFPPSSLRPSDQPVEFKPLPSVMTAPDAGRGGLY